MVSRDITLLQRSRQVSWVVLLMAFHQVAGLLGRAELRPISAIDGGPPCARRSHRPMHQNCTGGQSFGTATGGVGAGTTIDDQVFEFREGFDAYAVTLAVNSSINAMRCERDGAIRTLR